MAHKDFRSTFPLYPSVAKSERDPMLAKAEKIFAELSQELGLTEPDLLVSPHGVDEWTVVYDKFSSHSR